MEENLPVPESNPIPEKKGFNIKILVFGIPLFIIQLVAVYFITANILLSRFQAANDADPNHKTGGTENAENKAEEEKAEFGKFVYIVEDLIINPANTDGKRLLLASLGFDVATEAGHTEIKAKDILLKDAIISVMGSKEISKLSNISYRDTLRTEITSKLKKLMPKVKINTIYFSKYILQ